MQNPSHPKLTANAQATDDASIDRHFGGGDVLPLWIAEPYVDLAPGITSVLASRAGRGWYGYETRPADVFDAFWGWMDRRHKWSGAGLRTVVSPSVGTSIAVLIDLFTAPGDGVILQPPVFTDFKPLVVSWDRNVVRNALTLTADGYGIDLDGLEAAAADEKTTALILCNPHNPVGRVWSSSELSAVVDVCARHQVFVIADELHADIILGAHSFTPFASVVADTGVSWAALHGPLKTFGLAGVCDTLLVTDNDRVAAQFETRSGQLHLTRNNVFGIAAFEAAYNTGDFWLNDLLELVVRNRDLLKEQLPEGTRLSPMEGTYLAWLDCRGLNMDVPELATWLGSTPRLGLSPGHWFGREGAGFARMTIAAPTSLIEEAVTRLQVAVQARG